ncbi:hypothetical protein KR200_004015, partial [Drosophila serrata]
PCNPLDIMSEAWPWRILMQRLLNLLRQKQTARPGTGREGIDITKATFLVFAVFIMCATSWGPLISRKPLSARCHNNQDGAQPKPQPPAFN